MLNNHIMTNNSAKIFPLFSTPVYKGNIDISIPNKLEYLKKIKYYRYEVGNGFSSENHNILNEKIFEDIKEKIENNISSYLFDFLKYEKFDLNHCLSWINRHDPGDWSHPHSHHNSFISGILYLSFPNEKCGKTTFSMSECFPTYTSPSISPDTVESNIFNSYKFTIEVIENDLVLFPSHLYHEVSKNDSDKTRYSLAFNYMPSGTIGAAYPKSRLTI
jgi:uncharacterized protein (TIGR02466 family)